MCTRRPRGRRWLAAAAGWAAPTRGALGHTRSHRGHPRRRAQRRAHRRHPPPADLRPRAVPARPRRVHAQHAAAQPPGHRRPLRPRQRAVRADARPDADVLVRGVRPARRDARGGLDRQARARLREARPRPARPRRRDRDRLGRVRGLRRHHARLQGDHDHDLEGAARRRRPPRARSRSRAPRRPAPRRLPRPAGHLRQARLTRDDRGGRVAGLRHVLRALLELLAPNGTMLLQAITMDDRAYPVEKASKASSAPTCSRVAACPRSR